MTPKIKPQHHDCKNIINGRLKEGVNEESSARTCGGCSNTYGLHSKGVTPYSRPKCANAPTLNFRRLSLPQILDRLAHYGTLDAVCSDCLHTLSSIESHIFTLRTKSIILPLLSFYISSFKGTPDIQTQFIIMFRWYFLQNFRV